MSWGTDFTTTIFLSHMTFENKQEVIDKIEENNKEIEDAKKRIQMFVSATPKDIIDPEWKEQPIDWLVNSVAAYFEVIEDNIVLNVKLNQYLDYLETKEFAENK